MSFVICHLSFGLASCGGDDATYVPVEPLGITASDVLFESQGGTGSITANSTGTLLAETASTWLSLQVQGSRVTVSAPQNPSINGRSAKVSLKADGKESSIVVTQKGMVFAVEQKAFVLEANAATALSTPVIHAMAVTAETSADWLTPVFNEQTSRLDIAVDSNTSGTVRTATVTVSSGEAAEKIRVTQYDLTEDLYGFYSFDYRTKEGDNQSLLAIVQGGEMEIIFSATTSFFLPVEVDAERHSLTVQTPAYVGRYAGNLYTYLLAGHERSGTDQTTFRDVASSAVLSAVQDGDNWSLQTSVFGGSWERYSSSTGEVIGTASVDMWIFDLFNDRVRTTADWTDKWAGFSLIKCCRPHLVKLSNAEGEAWLAQYD